MNEIAFFDFEIMIVSVIYGVCGEGQWSWKLVVQMDGTTK